MTLVPGILSTHRTNNFGSFYWKYKWTLMFSPIGSKSDERCKTFMPQIRINSFPIRFYLLRCVLSDTNSFDKITFEMS